MVVMLRKIRGGYFASYISEANSGEFFVVCLKKRLLFIPMPIHQKDVINVDIYIKN